MRIPLVSTDGITKYSHVVRNTHIWKTLFDSKKKTNKKLSKANHEIFFTNIGKLCRKDDEKKTPYINKKLATKIRYVSGKKANQSISKKKFIKI